MIIILWVSTIDDPIKEAQKSKLNESSQRMIGKQNNNPAAINNHFKLQIKTLIQNAARDEDKLEAFLKAKEKEKQQEAIHIEYTQRLVTERLKCSALYCIW